LEGLYNLNVQRAAAAKRYQRLFLDHGIDAILMPPAPHTAVPLDHWTTASYTGLWNYLDFPAVVIPVDDVAASDALDETTNAKYGPDDAKVYSLCTYTFRHIYCLLTIARSRHRTRVL
jgi:amidase